MLGEDSPQGAHPIRPKRLSRSQLESMGRDTIIELYFESDEYIRYLESSISASGSMEERQRLKNQILELTRRENMLIMKLTLKEQQTRDFQDEIDTLKKRVIPQNSSQLRATLVDPAVNILFEKMKKELEQTKKKLEETQNELSAWKFTPDSNTGKRLMAKCRLLYQENEDLGKMISSGRVAKLESDLALQRSFAQEMKQSQKDQDEFLLELDEEVEGMQSTIYFLQQQLKEANQTIANLRGESNAAGEPESVESKQMQWQSSTKALSSEPGPSGSRPRSPPHPGKKHQTSKHPSKQLADKAQESSDEEMDSVPQKKTSRAETKALEVKRENRSAVEERPIKGNIETPETPKSKSKRSEKLTAAAVKTAQPDSDSEIPDDEQSPKKLVGGKDVCLPIAGSSSSSTTPTKSPGKKAHSSDMSLETTPPTSEKKHRSSSEEKSPSSPSDSSFASKREIDSEDSDPRKKRLSDDK